MENQLMVLPPELAVIAANVSAEKRNEVQSVLNHVFDGVAKMRAQLDSVIVADPDDRVNMKLANTIRLGVRQVRLEAEKTFDAKRTEVQQQMLGFKTEDSLWLKAKQTMQLLTKEIEENARWKEETRDRFEAEKRELKIQQRLLKISNISPETSRLEIENMSDDTFEIFFVGVEKAHNESIEAEKKAEAERIIKEKAEAAENERIRIENEKLRIEAAEKEKQLLAEREKAAVEKAKLEAEIKAKKDAEERMQKEAAKKAITEQKAKEAAERKEKNAPDRIKLTDLAAKIEMLGMPETKGEEAQKIISDVQILLAKVVVFIREKSAHL